MKKTVRLVIVLVAILILLAITISMNTPEEKQKSLGRVSITTTTLNVEKFEELAAIPTTKPVIKPQETTATTQPFSHENCQYPDRWSNPQNGCDNTDPASPECIDFMYSKQAEQECIEGL